MPKRFNEILTKQFTLNIFVLFALLQCAKFTNGLYRSCIQLLSMVPIAFLTWPALVLSKELRRTNQAKLSTQLKINTLYVVNRGKFISAVMLLWFRDTYREKDQVTKPHWGGLEYFTQMILNVFVTYGSAMLLGQLSWDPRRDFIGKLQQRLNFVSLDLKNQGFVCLSEECIYREFLGSFLPSLLGSSAACWVESLLFGAAYYLPRSDDKYAFPIYPAFCAMQGLFYHRAYEGAPEGFGLRYSVTYHGIFNMAYLLMPPYPGQNMTNKPVDTPKEEKKKQTNARVES